MEIIIYIIIYALIPTLIGLLVSHIIKNNSKVLIKNLKNEHIVIRLPKAYRWVGWVTTAFFLTFIIFSTLFPNGTETIWAYIGFSLFTLLGAYIVFETYIWKIDIFQSKSYFLFRRSPFKTYRIEYSDCIGYKFKNNSFLVITEKKTFHIDLFVTNGEYVLYMLTRYKVPELK